MTGRDDRRGAFRRRLRRMVSPRRLVLAVLLLIGAVALGSAAAYAYLGGAGTGSGFTGAASVGAGTTPSATQTTPNVVTVTWPAPFVPMRTPRPLYGNVVHNVPGVPRSSP